MRDEFDSPWALGCESFKQIQFLMSSQPVLGQFGEAELLLTKQRWQRPLLSS